MKRILVVSTLPETSGVGGVTIHTQRLLESKVLKNPDFQLELFDYKKNSVRDYLKKLKTCDVVHIHISNPKARLVFVSLAKVSKKKVILTVHGDLGRHRTVNNFFDKMAVRGADVPVLINDKSFTKAQKINKASVLAPAFIEPQTPDPLPHQIDLLIKEIDRHRYPKIYATNASKRNFDEQGNEIYGITFLINTFSKLDNKYLIISDPSGDYSESTAKTALPANILILNERHSFFELLKKCDGMIRATSTDGDAISIKEALYLGKDVIATDCVDRPKGVNLFKYDDSTSLLNALTEAERSHNNDKTQSIESAIPYLKDLYHRI